MYHDQGHTPMKLLAFESGVNVTVGLPIVRTSVDHGTAFDIAWQGVAFTGSLDHALSWAKRLATRRLSARTSTRRTQSSLHPQCARRTKARGAPAWPQCDERGDNKTRPHTLRTSQGLTGWRRWRHRSGRRP